MARRARSTFPTEGIYHVTSRGVGPAPIVGDDHDRSALVASLAEVGRRFAWTCHAWCLMTTHYHLVVEAQLDALSRGIHRANGPYAQRFNRRYDRSGHLFEGRFSIRFIDSEQYLEVACRYVLENPVRAGICAHPAQWPWGGTAERLA
jgi:putative transposase